ncbi:MAG: type II toxin-antitoxin system death-on-curing family toxin [Mycobacterium sp.]
MPMIRRCTHSSLLVAGRSRRATPAVSLARPRASAFGQDAYPDLCLKAAALLHSLARNDALVDGNKRLAWAVCRTFLAINGQWISAPEDERFDLVIGVAGVVADLEKIAEQLRTWSYQEG